MFNIESRIAAAKQIIFNSPVGSPEAVRAGYDLVGLRHKQDNPSLYRGFSA